MRLLIILGLIYIGYRVLRSWMSQNISTNRPVGSRTDKAIDDVMIKDPFCDVYFPKRQGVELRDKGRDLIFCSEDCRDKFLKSEENKN